MFARVLFLSALLVVVSTTPDAQQSAPALDNAAKALGAQSLSSITYSGAGANFALGQSYGPGDPWPRFNVKSYTCAIDYDTASWRQEMVRTQGENPPRGGGGQPLAGEQRQVQLASGETAWNMAGETATPAPAAATERAMQIWVTPHGFIKAAMKHNASVKANVVSFLVGGRRYTGTLNAQGLVETIETWLDNPVLGDMLVDTTYTGYKDFGGVKFPTRIVQKQGGDPVLDLTITAVTPNAPVTIDVPQNVRSAAAAPVKVEAQKIVDGVWYLTGGSHHSVAVEFADHVVVVEGPLNEERSLAVIAEVRKAVPNKPIRYLVNTHHHFDHSGGIRTYAAEGATIVTHQANRSFYEKAFSPPRTLNPDRLAQAKKAATFVTMTASHKLADATRTMELHHIQGNTHNAAIIMAYLPKEKILIEADAFNPPAPNAPPPATPNPFSVNLYENIQRLKLDVVQILPIHGRVVTLEDLEKAIGRS